MCALFGFLDYGKQTSHKTLQKLVQLLAHASEVRGTHASGISYIQNNELKIYKRPKPAHKMHFRIPDNTTALMGHTRFTTQGDQKKNCNNHPFRGYADMPFALAHNGVLYNDDSLRREKNLPATDIETDSYIAVQLIESQRKLSFESLRYAAEAVRGYFTFTLLDMQNRLYFVKGESPLYLLHFPASGLYVYASTKEIMEDALRRMHLQWQKHTVIDVREGEILCIDSCGSITRDCYTVQKDSYGFSYRYPQSYYPWEDTSHSPRLHAEYHLLADLCGYYGVTPEEVQYLFDMGYTYDEVEVFLMDPGALQAELACAEV